MRVPVVALLAVLLAFPAALPARAEETYVVLADWRSGRFAAGAPAPVDVEGVNAITIPFNATACPRLLLLDLLLAPDETGADVEGVGGVWMPHQARAQLWRNGTLVSTALVRHSGYGTPIGETTEEGPHEVRVLLSGGVDVAYDARLRGRLSPSACGDGVIVGA